jgi:hypothetical protein
MARTVEELIAEDAEADTQLAQQLTNLNQAISDAEAGMETAGSEVQNEIDQAEETATQSEQDYEQYLEDFQSQITTAQSQIENVEEPEGANILINSIGSINSIAIGIIEAVSGSVETGGTPDCSAAQINAAIASAIASVNTQVNTRLDEIETKVNLIRSEANAIIAIIKAALLAHDADLLNGAIAALKIVGQSTTEILQLQRDFTPPIIDVDSITSTEFQRIENLL